MRTMYIILSWIGWGWLAIVGTFMTVALSRRRTQLEQRGVPVEPAAEAEVRP